MRTADYEAVVASIASYQMLDCEDLLLRDYPNLESAQLSAILSQEVQKYTKQVKHVVERKTEELYSKYLALVEGGRGEALLHVARQHRFPPAMMAKLLLFHHLRLHPPQEAPPPDRGVSPPPHREDSRRFSSPPPPTGDRRSSADGGASAVVERSSAKDASVKEESFNLNNTEEDEVFIGSNTKDVSDRLTSAKDDSVPRHNDTQGSLNLSRLANASTSVNVSAGTENTTLRDTSVLAHTRRLQQQVKKMLRNTSLIPDKTLSYEVHLCLVSDPHYGPYSDAIKHSIGHEFEVLLVQRLTALGVAYSTEDVLRKQGCDKTPDVKLDVPIGVGGRVVNWIESKAMFGDRRNHRHYLKEQLCPYWNRFGPGLVIYWFGFTADLDTTAERGILLREGFPEDVELYEPSRVVGRPEE